MAKMVTATDLRTRIREVIQRAQFQGDHIIVTVFDKPAVAIIGIDDYVDYMAYKDQQQQQWELLRAKVEVEDAAKLDEVTDEELWAIIEGGRIAGQASRDEKAKV